MICTPAATVRGEAVNQSKTILSAIPEATFRDVDENTVGAARGLISELEPGEARRFELTARDDPTEHAAVVVRVVHTFP